MTISSTQVRKSFTGDGSTTAFTYNYRFLANADLKVYQEGVLKTLTTHYTVTGAGDPSGGTVTFVTAPAVDDEIVVVNDPSNTQTLDLVDNDPFPAESLEAALDRLTIQVQRCRDLLARTPTLSDTDLSSGTWTLPSPTSNYLLSWNLAGTALQNVDPSSLGTLTIGAGSITADLLASTLDLTGKTLTVATQSGSDSDTSAASTAMVQAAITARAATDAAAGIIAKSTTAKVQTGTDSATAMTPDNLRQGMVVNIAEAATTSGTTLDVGGIASWARYIRVHFKELSTNGTSAILVQLSDAGGPENSGYVGCGTTIGATIGAPVASSTGFNIVSTASAGRTYSGTLTLTRGDGNTWYADWNLGDSVGATAAWGGGHKTLSATLTGFRLTTASGDTLDDGAMGVVYW